MSNFIKGFALTSCLALMGFFLAKLSFFEALHLSPLIIAIVLAACLSPLYLKVHSNFDKGVSFSAKKLLRFGIILYGFNVSLLDIANVGISGVLLALCVVVFVLGLGICIGVRYFKIDKELAILISGGSAICGAAAVLALESAFRSKAQKSVIAISSVVVFGLLSMLVYPLLYFSGILPFDDTQMGVYIGLALHEVANVVGAASSISDESAAVAIIIKMIRVILLVPVLLILPLCFSKSEQGEKRKLHIPYFALAFLAVIIFHSFVPLPEFLLDFFKILCVLSLSAAMAALGLQIDLKSFASLGKDAFKLAFVLFVILLVLGFVLVFFFVR
ncbi:YeiH family putative sulfate export transporter [Campylobacter sp. MIT 12-8780]|uniref:YeiH family protein n=1 Tax=unclassified Campylobacter TaxID=2593542 RepID=UPI00115D2467|nr:MULTISPECIES: putative sulfate exporter family transporter [unclassified Campylobacter]NDJ26818.1 putative sulfate exporter family transporter [Campylobacter sp. MIT 19-121]TQR42361.1 YeiH family putative sulfate export transporter [Campylobacter sp. MIT 12-8780]